MKKQVTFVLEIDSGKITVEASGISTEVLTGLQNDLGKSENVNCGKPVDRGKAKPPDASKPTQEDSQSIWLYRVYHNSVVDGPGRRSVIQVAGCSIRCPGCYVPETHDRLDGTKIQVSAVVKEILKEKKHSDGVTILGGEPFDQPQAVAEIVSRINVHGLNIVMYSGYTMEALISRKSPAIDYILTHIDQLIDGPFVMGMRTGAGEYRGSVNQKIIDFRTNSELRDPLVQYIAIGLD